MISHIACIMDGNRRWAQKRGLPKVLGHREGVNVVEQVIKYCLGKSIKCLSLYTFSIENFKRSEEEKSFLFDLIVEQAERQLPRFIEHGIRVCFVGDHSLFPLKVKEVCERIERETLHQNALTVNILFCYGGQQEIVAVCKEALLQQEKGLLTVDGVTVEWFKQHLWSGHVLPPDIIIRTGGVKRLSNFLLYQAAYSELFFSDTLWPDFSVDELERIVNQYQETKRNFGQ